MKIRLLYFSVSILFLTSFVGCKKLNPDEQIPSYITIPYYKFTADTINQGTTLQGFTDVWIYTTDGKLLGCFPIGTNIPILAEGQTSLLMRAGMKNCGAGDLRSYFPVTQFYTANLNLVRGQTQTVVPDFSYFSGATFLRLESFSNAGTFLAQAPSSDTMLVMYQGSESIPGQGKCGYVYLDNTYQVFEAKSGAPHPYTQGAPCFLEIQFKSDVDVYVSVSDGNVDVRLACVFKASTQWKKMYVNLTDYLNSPSTLNNFYFVIHASKPSAASNAYVYFDNIKLIRQ